MPTDPRGVRSRGYCRSRISGRSGPLLTRNRHGPLGPASKIAYARAERIGAGSAMRRREFITLIGGASASWPLVARAQQKVRVRQIGILMPFPQRAPFIQNVREFRQGLSKLGWSEGGNVQFDERWSTDNMDVVRADAANLVALNPDVIVIVGDRVIPILTKLTRSIPIVVALTSDPIASGAVESLARPGRN